MQRIVRRRRNAQKKRAPNSGLLAAVCQACHVSDEQALYGLVQDDPSFASVALTVSFQGKEHQGLLLHFMICIPSQSLIKLLIQSYPEAAFVPVPDSLVRLVQLGNKETTEQAVSSTPPIYPVQLLVSQQQQWIPLSVFTPLVAVSNKIQDADALVSVKLEADSMEEARACFDKLPVDLLDKVGAGKKGNAMRLRIPLQSTLLSGTIQTIVAKALQPIHNLESFEITTTRTTTNDSFVTLEFLKKNEGSRGFGMVLFVRHDFMQTHGAVLQDVLSVVQHVAWQHGDRHLQCWFCCPTSTNNKETPRCNVLAVCQNEEPWQELSLKFTAYRRKLPPRPHIPHRLHWSAAMHNRRLDVEIDTKETVDMVDWSSLTDSKDLIKLYVSGTCACPSALVSAILKLMRHDCLQELRLAGIASIAKPDLSRLVDVVGPSSTLSSFSCPRLDASMTQTLVRHLQTSNTTLLYCLDRSPRSNMGYTHNLDLYCDLNRLGRGTLRSVLIQPRKYVKALVSTLGFDTSWRKKHGQDNREINLLYVMLRENPAMWSNCG